MNAIEENKELMELVEQLQTSCHKMVGFIVGINNKVSVQDATNIWLFNKIAELEIRLRKLEGV